MYGFVFTVTNITGVNIGQINTASYASFTSLINMVVTFAGGTPPPNVHWNLYQERSNNHMYRPVYAVSQALPAQIYRVTSNNILLLMDFSTSTLSNIDFYNYPLYVKRFHSYHVTPGSCS